jgi:hypothetical protein
MNPLRAPRCAWLVTAAASLLAVQPLFAIDWVTNQVGEFTTGGNWVGGNVPQVGSGQTATISSGTATFTPGGDFTLSGTDSGSPGTLIINGTGTFTQTTSNAWFKVGNGAGTYGAVILNGGTFNLNGSDNFLIGNGGGNGAFTMTGGSFIGGDAAFALLPTGTANISGGTLSINTISALAGTFNLSGGLFDINAELRIEGSGVTISGGTLNTPIIAFQGAAQTANITGGRLELNGTSAFNGFFANGTSHLNFLSGSSGVVYVSDIATVDIAGVSAAMLASRIRLNGVADASAFTVTQEGTGFSIALVPEPTPGLSAALALAGLALLARRRPTRGVSG